MISFAFFSSQCLTCLKVIFDSQLNCNIDLITIFGVHKLNENSYISHLGILFCLDVKIFQCIVLMSSEHMKGDRESGR